MKRFGLAVGILLGAISLQASSVQYQVSGMGDGFTVIAPDFLTNLYPGETNWSFSKNELAACGHQPNNCVFGMFREMQHDGTPSVYAASILYNRFSDSYFPGLEAYFDGASLGAFGTYTYASGSTVIATLSITSSELSPSLAPEPSTYAMLAIGLALVAMGAYRRKKAIA